MNRYKDLKNRLKEIEQVQKNLVYLFNSNQINKQDFKKLNESYFCEYYFLSSLLLRFN